MTRSISLDIASLHTAYQQGALTPPLSSSTSCWHTPNAAAPSRLG
jgi:hypothetical protein